MREPIYSRNAQGGYREPEPLPWSTGTHKITLYEMVIARSRCSWVRAASLAVVGCGDPPELALLVTPGYEETAFTDSPPIEDVEIVVRALDDSFQLEANAAPGEAFALGEIPSTSVVTFDLTGFTADGDVVARGRSVAIEIATIDVSGGPLPLFMQRLGAFARPPGAFVRSHVECPTGVLAERYLLMTGGTAAYGTDGQADESYVDYYDLVTLRGYESSQRLPLAAQSMVVRGTTVLIIADEAVNAVDLSTGVVSEIELPGGLLPSDLSRGVTIDGAAGRSFVVGGIREGDPSDAVLVIEADGNLSSATLQVPRAGAAAAYVTGLGLVVVGGSDAAPGVEVVRDDLTVGALAFPPDAATGSAASVSPTLSDQLVLIGGRRSGQPAGTRVLDLRCPSNCFEVDLDLDSSTISSRGRAFTSDSGIIAVGDSEAVDGGPGETRVLQLTVDLTSIQQLPLRDPRRGATAVPAPNGTLAIVGGLRVSGDAARTVEVLFPESP